MKKRLVLGILFIGTVYFLLPLLSSPNTFLYRNNDLEEFFWPLLEYVKRSIINTRTIPLWNSMWFGGQPLISDPQTPSVYLPNVVFLLFPIYYSFIVSISLHLFLAAVFFYLFLRTIGNNSLSSVTGALIYISTPRLAASIEAGHFGLITAWTWIACTLYLVSRMTKFPHPKLAVLLAISITLLVQSHVITAIIIVPTVVIIGLLTTKHKRQFILFSMISGILTGCFLGPSLIPQLLWQKITTRSLLLNNPETYPLWSSKAESITYLFQEVRLLFSNQIETEKIIGIGSFVILLSTVSAFRIKKYLFAILLVGFGFLFVLVLNNASPVYNFILSTPLLILMRVTSRVWVLALVALILLAVRTLNLIQKKRLAYLLCLIALTNSYVLGWHVLARSYGQSNQVSDEVYKYIQSNPLGKVWCLNHCINQRKAAEHNIMLIDGYATIQQLNYYQTSWGLFGGYWNYYTLAIPPFGVESIQSLQPDYELLGRYNVGYIISKNTITSPDLHLARIINGYHIYTNTRVYPHFYFNKIQNNEFRIHSNGDNLRFESYEAVRELIIGMPYSPGWILETDRGVIYASESPDRLIVFSIPPKTTQATIRYVPPGHSYGLILFIIGSIFTILLLRFHMRITRIVTSYKKTAVPMQNDS